MNRQQTFDFAQLAMERCEDAFRLVEQLMENDRQAYGIRVAVACSMIQQATDLMRAGMAQQNGKRPSYETALALVITDMLDALGVTWRPSNSPTRSAKK